MNRLCLRDNTVTTDASLAKEIASIKSSPGPHEGLNPLPISVT